ncbi:MAG: prepilin-type N-terminal cleavage/methylation domain-containing protein [bacterium]
MLKIFKKACLTGRQVKKQNGFTLAEMMVTMSVFAITSVMLSGIFVNISHIQKNTENFQRLQNDGRYMIEKLAREIRGRELRYPANMTNYLFFEKDENGQIVLVCFDSTNKLLKYYVTGQDNEATVENCKSYGADLNAGDVEIDDVKFLVYPQIADKWGTAPTVNAQPRVTVMLNLKNKTDNPVFQRQLSIQTTISGKVYKR